MRSGGRKPTLPAPPLRLASLVLDVLGGVAEGVARSLDILAKPGNGVAGARRQHEDGDCQKAEHAGKMRPPDEPELA
jgi:hypothetical protein